jgi:mono/diheme cytochrome c family protein
MRALVIAAALGLASSAAVGDTPPDGKALYREKCVMCHDKTGMGTGLLSRRMQVAELLLRSDLQADFVVSVARAGVGNMPAIPRGEVSDRDLKAIADFLAQPAEAKK